MMVPLSMCLKWIDDKIACYNRAIDRGLRQQNISKAQNALAAREACESLRRDFQDDFERCRRLAALQKNGRKRGGGR